MTKKNGLDALALAAFGRLYTQNFVTLDTPLTSTGKKRRVIPGDSQKRVIVLHSTVDNRGGVHWLQAWNNGSRAASAHFVVERDSSTRHPRPAPLPTDPGPTTRDDRTFSDAVIMAPTAWATFHGGDIANRHGIGIEVSNRVHKLQNADLTNEPSRIDTYADTNGGGAIQLRRPADENRWFRVAKPFRGGNKDLTASDQQRDFQFWEDVQYGALILLLRRLCIMHRIPRRFLGADTTAARDMWNQSGGISVSKKEDEKLPRAMEALHAFRGIMVHHNIARKPCPGVLHRNRLYRGLIDEWWMPIEIEERNYYTGPYEMPPFIAGAPTRPGLFHWDGTALQGTVLKAADLDRLYDTRSHFNTTATDDYYSRAEHGQGGYPVGINGAPHGGLHLRVPDNNRGVFAAASGTIVAARLTSEPTTEAEPQFGSQRFVLIRHAINVHHEVDPQGAGAEDLRVDYGEVTWVYTLYMHLRPIADLSQESDANPPWFNLWIRHNGAQQLSFEGDAGAGLSATGVKGEVFCPDVEVSVGDFLGAAAGFSDDADAFHFEVFSGRSTEIGGDRGAYGKTPWDDGGFRFDDVSDATQQVELAGDPASPYTERLWVRRAVKFRGRSEWALTAASLEPHVPNDRRRQRVFTHAERFSWVTEAIAACPNLAEASQFGGSDGVFWHYHPVTFMNHMADVVRRESTEFSEKSQVHKTKTNVVLDDHGFIVRFVDWDAAAAAFNDVPADGKRIRSSQRSKNDLSYNSRRHDIACRQEIAAGGTPTTTRFSFGLLEIIEQFRQFHSIVKKNVSVPVPVSVESAFLHGVHAVVGNCCVGTTDSVASHVNGLALDLKPANPTPANVIDFWGHLTEFLAEEVDDDIEHCCGNPAYGELPADCSGIRAVATPPAVASKLLAGDTLTSAEASSFCAHIELY